MSLYHNLYERHKPEFQIYEGLIVSHPLYKVNLILKKDYTIKSDYKTNTFSLRFQFSNSYTLAEYELKKLLKLTNNLGWFPANMSSYDNDGNFKQLVWDENLRNFAALIKKQFTNILFLFEAKYDIQVEDFPDILYHVCEKKYADKILKIGLVPRSRSKKAFHPERVYLCKDLNDAVILINQFDSLDKNKYWVILRIDVFSIQDYLKLYKDPNYAEKGFYTLNNIPPFCISKLK